MSESSTHPGAMLTGAELLNRVKELGDAPKSELVRSCGYVSTKKDGSERLNFTAFYEALLEAKGLHLGDAVKTPKRRGREPSFHTRVQFNGNLMVGSAYTSQLGFKPGDTFEIKLGRRHIQLVPVDAADLAAELQPVG
jgi:AbrB-like transcriptional regulator